MARKFIELKFGCMAKAFEDKPTFVLLGRDPCAALVIRMWVEARILVGKNTSGDAQTKEALSLADMIDKEQKEWQSRAKKVK